MAEVKIDPRNLSTDAVFRRLEKAWNKVERLPEVIERERDPWVRDLLTQRLREAREEAQELDYEIYARGY